MFSFLLKIKSKNNKFINYFIQNVFKLLGIDFPKEVHVGKNLVLPHRGNGVVLHKTTIIGDNVKIYQQCTVGRADIWKDKPDKNFSGVEIQDNVIICAGAKVLTSEKLVIGNGTIIGANAVLVKSTGENEVWAGIPAVLIKKL